MPVAVGMYLPFGLATPIVIGGLINHFLTRQETAPEEIEKKSRRGVLFSSGIIAGEALTGVGLALLASMSIVKPEWDIPYTTVLTFVGVALFLGYFTRVSAQE